MKNLELIKNIDVVRFQFPAGISEQYFRVNTIFSNKKISRIYFFTSNDHFSIIDPYTEKDIARLDDLLQSNIFITLVNKAGNIIQQSSRLENFLTQRHHNFFQVNDYIDWNLSFISKRGAGTEDEILCYIFYDNDGKTEPEVFSRARTFEVPRSYDGNLLGLTRSFFFKNLRAIEYPGIRAGYRYWLSLYGRNGESIEAISSDMFVRTNEHNAIVPVQRNFMLDVHDIDLENSRLIMDITSLQRFDTTPLTFYYK